MPASLPHVGLVPSLLACLACLAQPALAAADLAATLDSSVLSVSAGGEQVFDAGVQNLGPGDALPGIVEEFSAPPNAVVVDAWGDGWACDPVTADKATCLFVDALPAGHYASPFHVRMLAPPQPGTVTAVAMLPAADSFDGNNAKGRSTSVIAAPGAPDLRTHMPADLVVQTGGGFVLNVEVENAGAANASGAILRSRIPAVFAVTSIDAAQDWQCSLTRDLVTCVSQAPISAGAVATAAILHLQSVTMQSPNVVSAFVAAASDAAPADNIDVTTVFVTPPPVELSAWIDQAPALVAVDQAFGYQIAVKNAGSGNDSATMHLTGDLDGAAFAGGGGIGGWACNFDAGGTHFDCAHPGLSAGDVAVLSVAATAPSVPGAATLSIAVQGGQGPDPLPGNDGDTWQTTIEAPDAALLQAAPAGNVVIGSSVEFVLTASNGASLATAGVVTVTDTLPPQVSFASATGPGWNCSQANGVVTCSRPSLPAASTAPPISIKAQASSLGVASNVANISIAGDPNAANDGTIQTFRVVAPPNQPPQIPAGQSLPVAETAAAGAAVGTVVASDPDPADTLSFSMPQAATLPFTIDPANGLVSVDAPLDHEATPLFADVQIAVSDGHATTLQTITIVVTDVGGPDDVEHLPVIGNERHFSVREDAGAGSVVGQVDAGDADPEDTLAFSLADDALLPFTVDAATGQLRVDGPLDFETAPSFPALDVHVTDGKNDVAANFVVDVRDFGGLDDVNVAPAIAAGQIFHVKENATPGTPFGALQASDADVNDVLAFAMPAAGGLPFEIGAATGVLRVDAPLDFESTPVFTAVVVSASDGAAQVFGTVTIAVDDFGGPDDVNSPPTIVPGQVFHVSESAAPGTVFGTLVANDGDPNDVLVYAMPGAAALPFEIDPATGALRVDGTLDFEATPQFDAIQVSMDDGTAQAQSTITVIVDNFGGPDDINELPDIAPGQVFHIAENSPAGTPIGVVVAQDPDAGDVLEFALPAAAGLPFAIDADTGTLLVDGNLDFEQIAAYPNVVVQAGDGTATVTRSVSILVDDLGGPDDVNDAPTIAAGQVFAVDENVPAGTPVGWLQAADADPADTLVYSLPGDAFLPFTIDPATGRIEVDGPLDFETTPVYAGLLVQVDDGQAVTGQAVTIHVLDMGGPNDVGDGNAAPQANDDFLLAPPGKTTVFAPGTLLANDTDADGDALAALRIGIPQPPGTVVDVQANGGFTLQPPSAQFEGVVDFDYRVDDGHGGTDDAHVAVLVDGGRVFGDGFEATD